VGKEGKMRDTERVHSALISSNLYKCDQDIQTGLYAPSEADYRASMWCS